MKVLRIPAHLVERVYHDMARPHAFALERVGFLFGRAGNRGYSPELILLNRYESVDDGDYEEDNSVGARISGAAIRKAMQIALDDEACCFHVHMHDHTGTPRWSTVDRGEIPPVARSFANVMPAQNHGAVLLSRNAAVACVFDRVTGALVPVSKCAVVGSFLDLNPEYGRD